MLNSLAAFAAVFCPEVTQMDYLFLLVCLELWTATANTTLLTCRIKTSARPFTQHRTLELREVSYYLDFKPPSLGRQQQKVAMSSSQN
jgi:hypothetical protein